MQNDDPLIVRIGTFFVVIGSGVLLLFVMSDIAGKTQFDYLFISMLLIGFGWMLRRKKAPPPPAGRFSGIKKILRRNKGGSGASQQEPKE
jgi:hypothetical protein